MNRTEDHILSLFMIHVDISTPKDVCWIWEGALDWDGYGRFSWPERNIRKASQASYELFNGSRNGLSVLHLCDTRACVNPNHLFLGTQIDNVEDMWNKDRGWRGGCIGSLRRDTRLRAKLIQIRILAGSGRYSTNELIHRFNVTSRLVKKVVPSYVRSY